MSKLKVIVPYRNRPDQLDKFINYLFEYLRNTSLEFFNIYVVEQKDNKDFNKGCLLNIGFLETHRERNSYYCFHDIDLLPKSSQARYIKPPLNTIIHPYGHKHCLSNKILINTNTFVKLNGFSTKYWKWGFEDTDFQLRAKYNQVSILRNNFSERFNSNIYFELDNQSSQDIHKKMGKINSRVNQILFYNTLINPDITCKEGLNTTEYKIVGREDLEKYTHIYCEVQNENRNKNYIESFKKYSV